MMKFGDLIHVVDDIAEKTFDILVLENEQRENQHEMSSKGFYDGSLVTVLRADFGWQLRDTNHGKNVVRVLKEIEGVPVAIAYGCIERVFTLHVE